MKPLHKNITVTCSPNELPLILNASDVAAILGISRAKAYQLFHRLDFPTLKLDKRLLVRRELFFQWLDKQAQVEGYGG